MKTSMASLIAVDIQVSIETLQPREHFLTLGLLRCQIRNGEQVPMIHMPHANLPFGPAHFLKTTRPQARRHPPD